MKGTLFSADFISDSGSLRLLELNTDTAVSNNGLNHLDFSGFIDILSGSSITEVHTVSKSWHKNIVNALSESLNASASFVTSFQNTLEEDTTIYPTTIADDSSKFILRMAYDESAIFDSQYTKNKLGPLELFTTNGNSGSVAEYYISSSTDGVSDYLPNSFNSTNIPDVLVKDLASNVNNPIKFYKIGKSSETAENRYSEFKTTISEDELLIKFYENTSDARVKSIRSLNLIYGTDLNILNLGNFTSEAIFDKPISIEYDDNVIDNEIDVKHYYELATSFPRFSTIQNWGGIFEEEEILKSDGTAVLISSASVGDSFKSYFISGSPDTDVVSEFMDWSYDGSSLPSGSYPTSSILINNIEQPLTYNLTYKFTLSDASTFRAGAGSHMLVYDTSRDSIRYEDVYAIRGGEHQLIDLNGGLVDITDITLEVLDGQYSNYILDMETADTFFLSNGELSVKIVTHNCFPAGTKITLADGTHKNIEDITTSDKLLTFNEKTSELVEGTIGNIVQKKDRLLIKLSFDDNEIKSTALHKFFVKDKGWIPAQDIVIGDVLLNSDKEEIEVIDREELVGEFEVYHILDVKDNHTYFANDILVHNFKYTCFVAGTEITLADGDVKNIEDIVVGEEVLTYNEENGVNEIGVVGDLKQHEVDSIVRITLDNEIVINTTSEHPFYVNGKGWVKAGELEVLDTCKKYNGEESLVSTVDVIEETHTVYNLLNVSENHNFYANGILVHNKL